MRKWVLLLAVVAALAALAGVAFIFWFGAEDARQAALLDARVRQAEDRATQARDRFDRLRQDKAPAEEVRQAERERVFARYELDHLRDERDKRRREASWPVRVLREARRRAGW